MKSFQTYLCGSVWQTRNIQNAQRNIPEGRFAALCMWSYKSL